MILVKFNLIVEYLFDKLASGDIKFKPFKENTIPDLQ